ncbi:MAG: phytanoyl-CoA dioxygenase family protein [Paludibaculum sp.]
MTCVAERVPDSLSAAVETRGFALCRSPLNADLLQSLEAALGCIDTDERVRSRGAVFAIRDLLIAAPAIRAMANADPLLAVARAAIGRKARPVRGLLFDKHPAANWLVPWHQDLTICVKERLEVKGFGPWSGKADLVHVQPPAEILDQMVALRIHLDDAGETNGALRLLPGTPKLGRLTPEQVEKCRETNEEMTCAAARGDVLLMKPLLLHASSAALQPGHRRVIHIEYASCSLPGGLCWQEESARHGEVAGNDPV